MAEKPDPDTNIEPDTRLRSATPIDPEIAKPAPTKEPRREVDPSE